MRIVVLGAQGQLGSDLVPRLDGDVRAWGRADVDITDAARLSAALDAARPEIVINCAAYNQVDQAEDEPERAFAVNERLFVSRRDALQDLDEEEQRRALHAHYATFLASVERPAPTLVAAITAAYGLVLCASAQAVAEKVRAHRSVARWLERAAGVFLIGFGIRLVKD